MKRPERAAATPASGDWRVAVVEDHLLQRRATVDLLQRARGLRVVLESETLPEFLRRVPSLPDAERPQLLVLDLVVDRGPSVEPEVVRRLIDGGLRVVVVSALSDPPLVREVLRAGVGGIVGKRDPEADLLAAVWTVLGGGRWMTPDLREILGGDPDRPTLSDQEARALVLYASGHTLDHVARQLGVKQVTAKTYVDRVKAKYAAVGRPVRTKVDLARVAVTDGYLQR